MKTYFLKRNKRTELPTHFAAVYAACDTIPDPAKPNILRHPLRYWHAAVWRQERQGPSRLQSISGLQPATFWEWLIRHLSPYRPLWLWTHDAPRHLLALRFFDHMRPGCFSLLEPDWRVAARTKPPLAPRPRHGLIADSDPPTILHVWHETGAQLIILDTLNWYRFSLPELAASLNVNAIPEPIHTSADVHWCRYAQAQTGLIQTIARDVHTFVKEKDLGCMKYTLPGQAMQHYRHAFLAVGIKPSDIDSVRTLERAAYVGGRIDPFYVGKVYTQEESEPWAKNKRKRRPFPFPIGPVYHLDVSNLYPHVMATQRFPCRLEMFRGCELPESQWHSNRLQASVAQVLLDSPDHEWPVRTETETLYCTGRIRTFLAGPDLLLAKMLGVLRGIEAIATYALADLFSEYVHHWWALRQAAKAGGNPVHSQIAKDFLLSFYGKWGERRHAWDTVDNVPARQRWGVYFDRDPVTREYRMCRAIGGTLQVKGDPGEAPHAFPAIAAFVTSYARRHMESLRECAGLRDCYYQGTDSLFVSSVGYTRLQAAGHCADSVLGKLRLVERLESMHTWGCHDYEKDGTIVRGGISKETVRLANGVVEQVSHAKLKSALCTEPPECPLSLTNPIPDRQPYTRGKVGKDGWVTPLKRNDWP